MFSQGFPNIWHFVYKLQSCIIFYSFYSFSKKLIASICICDSPCVGKISPNYRKKLKNVNKCLAKCFLAFCDQITKLYQFFFLYNFFQFYKLQASTYMVSRVWLKFHQIVIKQIKFWGNVKVWISQHFVMKFQSL